MKSKQSNLHPFLVTPLRPSVILNFWRNRPNQNSVRLGAIKDILDRAGFKPVDRQEIHQVSEFAGWSDEELNAEYKRMMQAEMERHTRDQQMVGMFEHENYLEEGFEDN